jgi:hypothetical protein
MMNEVFVVYYDEYYPGYGEKPKRAIYCVVDSVEKARAKVHELNKRFSVSYADYEIFEVE